MYVFVYCCVIGFIGNISNKLMLFMLDKYVLCIYEIRNKRMKFKLLKGILFVDYEC